MIKNLWSTPFLHTSMPDDIRDAVATRLLLDYDLSNPPADFGKTNVLLNESEEIVEFKNSVIYPAFNQFLEETLGKNIQDWSGHKMNGWLTGKGANYNINYHNHRGSQLSAVFYILTEEAPIGGNISFTDPRQNANRGYDEAFLPWFEDLKFKPRSGELVVFPSFLYHFVETYKGNIRLAIPVDLFLHTNK